MMRWEATGDMPAKVSHLGYEAWCEDCDTGSGITTRTEARKWKKNHNQRNHS